MKVNVYQTVEVSDEQRVQIANLVDGALKPKRQATRDEIKEFVWEAGAEWEAELADLWNTRFGDGTGESDEDAEERQRKADELAARVNDSDDSVGTEEDEDIDGESLI